VGFVSELFPRLWFGNQCPRELRSGAIGGGITKPPLLGGNDPAMSPLELIADANSAFWEGESCLRQILDNTTAVVYVKDREGRFLFVNRHGSVPDMDFIPKPQIHIG
jgi:PAS domain-containing protein